jgi:aldehyde:ferredoxin oxidoreductase
MGVAYATCNRGACHLRAWTPAIETSGDPGYNHGTEGKSKYVVEEQNKSTSHDNTGVCLFTAFAGASHNDLAALTSAATGIDFSEAEYLKAGERTWNLEKLWNLRAGLKKKHDTLPERLLKEGHKAGPSAGVTVNLDAMLPEYYKLRGWSMTGKPSKRKLKQLGLAEVAS